MLQKLFFQCKIPPVCSGTSIQPRVTIILGKLDVDMYPTHIVKMFLTANHFRPRVYLIGSMVVAPLRQLFCSWSVVLGPSLDILKTAHVS